MMTLNKKELLARKEKWMHAIPHMSLDESIARMRQFGVVLEKNRLGKKEELKKITKILKRNNISGDIFKELYTHMVQLHTARRKSVSHIFHSIEQANLEDLIGYVKKHFGLTFYKKGNFKVSDLEIVKQLEKEKSHAGEVFRAIQKRLHTLTSKISSKK